MNYCRDCKFCRPVSRFDILGWGETRWRFATCENPELVTVEAVTGKYEEFCSGQRVSYTTIKTCGENGDYFVPKHGTPQSKEIAELERMLK